MVEVALTPLLDGQREEEAAPVLGEQRHLPLWAQTERFLHQTSATEHRDDCFSQAGSEVKVRQRFTCPESQVSDDSACL